MPACRNSTRLRKKVTINNLQIAVCFLVNDEFPTWGIWRAWLHNQNTTQNKKIKFIIQPTGLYIPHISSPCDPQITYLPHVRTKWAQVSIVEAEMKLFDKAVNLGCQCAYLVSEQTIPLFSLDEFHKRARRWVKRGYDAAFQYHENYTELVPFGPPKQVGSQFMFVHLNTYQKIRKQVLLKIEHNRGFPWKFWNCHGICPFAPDEFILQSLFPKTANAIIVSHLPFNGPRTREADAHYLNNLIKNIYTQNYITTLNHTPLCFRKVKQKKTVIAVAKLLKLNTVI